MPGRPQGIPEVPPTAEWQQLRRFLVESRNALKRLEASVVPPKQPSNLVATGKAGGVVVQFTRSDGDTYILYVSKTKSFTVATRIDLGMAAEYTHDIGAADETRYYWVKAKKGQLESLPTGPVGATTLALAVEITPPEPPPASQTPTRSDETGEVEPGRPTGSTYEVV